MKILNPGDIKINFIKIYNGIDKFVDVSKLFLSLNLYEDIMSAFVTGKIVLSDSSSLNALLPFIGEETIEISFETPGYDGDDFKFKRLFHIYKIETLENINPKNAIIELVFVSIDGFVDMNTRISQTFKGSVSDTVRKLITSKQYLGSSREAIVEPTISNCIHTSNFWTPAQNIFFLAAEAYNNKNNPNYVFFENKDGFNFVSFDAMYDQRPVVELVRDEKSRQNTPDGDSLPDPQNDYLRVLDMSTKGLYDYIDRLETGMYGSAMYHYDVQTRRMRFMQRNSKTDFKSSSLNELSSINQPTTFIPMAKLLTKITHKGLYPNNVPGAPDKDMRRTSLLKRAESFKTNVRIFGRANYKVGDIIDLKVYLNEQVTEKTQVEKMFDPMLSGKYLVSALSHEISMDAHYCNMELIKDSYNK